jgi:septal ring factor EnvC (AmiA/AmiB activator)
MNKKTDRGFAVPVILAFAALSSGCVVSQSKYTKLQNQESATEASLAASQQQASDLTKQVGDLQAKIGPLEKERDQLKAKVDEFMKLAKKVQESLAAAQGELSDYLKNGGPATALPAATVAPTAPSVPAAPAAPRALKQVDRPAAPTDPN